MNQTEPIKKKRVQGKLDMKLVAKGLAMNMKKKDIAAYAGSKATTDIGKIHSVNQVINSSQFQAKMAQKVEMANDSLTKEKLDNTNAVGLATIIDKLSRASGLASNSFEGDTGTTFHAKNILIQYGMAEQKNSSDSN